MTGGNRGGILARETLGHRGDATHQKNCLETSLSSPPWQPYWCVPAPATRRTPHTNPPAATSALRHCHVPQNCRTRRTTRPTSEADHNTGEVPITGLRERASRRGWYLPVRGRQRWENACSIMPRPCDTKVQHRQDRHPSGVPGGSGIREDAPRDTFSSLLPPGMAREAKTKTKL